MGYYKPKPKKRELTRIQRYRLFMDRKIRKLEKERDEHIKKLKKNKRKR